MLNLVFSNPKPVNYLLLYWHLGLLLFRTTVCRLGALTMRDSQYIFMSESNHLQCLSCTPLRTFSVNSIRESGIAELVMHLKQCRQIPGFDRHERIRPCCLIRSVFPQGNIDCRYRHWCCCKISWKGNRSVHITQASGVLTTRYAWSAAGTPCTEAYRYLTHWRGSGTKADGPQRRTALLQ